MGFIVTCPNCGARPYTEFWFDAELASVLPGEASSAEEEFDRIWMRVNTDGEQMELWFHAAGCRRWLTVTRNTSTNEIHAR